VRRIALDFTHSVQLSRSILQLPIVVRRNDHADTAAANTRGLGLLT